MKTKKIMLLVLLICIGCVERSSTLEDDSSKIDVTIGSLEAVYSFSMADNEKAFVMIQNRDEIAKVYKYNLTKEEKDSTQKLIDKVIRSSCGNSEGLSTKEDYLMALKQSDTTTYFFTSQNCNDRSVMQKLKNYLIKTYVNSKPMLVFESANSLVLPPPPPIKAPCIDSVKFLINYK